MDLRCVHFLLKQTRLQRFLGGLLRKEGGDPKSGGAVLDQNSRCGQVLLSDAEPTLRGRRIVSWLVAHKRRRRAVRASFGSMSSPYSRQVPHDWQLPPCSIVPSTRMVRGHGSPVGVG
jgi:hypothetical protein